MRAISFKSVCSRPVEPLNFSGYDAKRKTKYHENWYDGSFLFPDKFIGTLSIVQWRCKVLNENLAEVELSCD